MNKTSKKWFIAAVMLLIVGAALILLAACSAGWDISKFGTVEYITSTEYVGEDFNGIRLKSYTADIAFLPSDDGKCKVVSYDREGVEYSVAVTDGVLTVEAVDGQKWYEYAGINFETPKITVYLPKSEYTALTIDEKTGDINVPKEFVFESVNMSVSTGNVKFGASVSGALTIKATTGDVRIEDTALSSLEISVSTGNVTVTNVSAGEVAVTVTTGKTNMTGVLCSGITSRGSTGSITLSGVIAEEKIYVKRSTGDVKFDGSDAGEIFVETGTGNVSGTLLSEKIFTAKSDTGRVDVPNTVTGGRCEVTSDTGNIKLSLKQ